MSYYTVDVNIDVDDFLEQCSTSDIEEVIQYLIRRHYIRDYQLKSGNKNKLSPTEYLFEEALNKLHGKWNRLTVEDEQIIYNISKQF